MSLTRVHEFDGVTVPNQARFEGLDLQKIKDLAKNPKGKPPLTVDAQGNVTTDVSGTNVPKGEFHTLVG